MAHANGRLTEFGRLLLVQRITELGWPQPRPPRPWGCRGPPPTRGLAATKAKALLALPIGARDPPLPHALPAAQVGRGLAARRRRRPGPHRLGDHLAVSRSTS
jgi:hypothetical protein